MCHLTRLVSASWLKTDLPLGEGYYPSSAQCMTPLESSRHSFWRWNLFCKTFPTPVWLGWPNTWKILEALAGLVTRAPKNWAAGNRPLFQAIQLWRDHFISVASQQGFGAVTYLRITDQSDAVKCMFVMGKSRLAPIKPVTIPCLELSAAVIATRLDRISRNKLTLPITESFFWTDNTCVLWYIENQDKRFQTFVANCIATIHDVSSPLQWKYVNTQDNPADDSSRGVPADFLQCWIHGPNFFFHLLKCGLEGLQAWRVQYQMTTLKVSQRKLYTQSMRPPGIL